MLRSIISFISVFMLFASLINIMLSVLVYYAFHDYCYEFIFIRWPMSAGIVIWLLWTEKLTINNIRLRRH